MPSFTSTSSSSSSSSVASYSPFDSNSTLDFNLTYSDVILRHCHAALTIDRVVTPVWYVIGIVGNVISASAWLQPQMRKDCSSAVYLAALSVNDTLFLLLHPLQELKYAWFVSGTVDYPVVCGTYAMVFLVTQYLAPVIAVCFSIDRFVAVCHPFKKKSFCTVHGALKVLVVSASCCLVLCAIQPYLWYFDGDACSVREEALRGGQRSLWAVWNWVTELLVFLLVPLLNLVFNVLVIREIRSISAFGLNPNRANVRHLSTEVAATNAMLLIVSFYVIFTTLPATLVYALEPIFREGEGATSDAAIAADPAWGRHFTYVTVRKIVDEFCLSHYAGNVFLFAITGKRFRKLVRRKFLCEERRRYSGSLSRVSGRTLRHSISGSKV